MAFTEQTLELDNAHISNLFGQFDCYLKKLERAFGTQIIDRDGTVHIRGEQSAVAHTAAVFTELQELARRGNQIQEQNVDYAIAMHMEQGRPVPASALRCTLSDHGRGKLPTQYGKRAH